MSLLELKEMSLEFGGVKANDKISFNLHPGKLYGLIGPNGAGKSTIFNVISGIYSPSKGDVIFSGKTLVGLKPYQIARLGIGRTFQNIRLFQDLSVEENVMSAFFSTAKSGFFDNLFANRMFRREEDEGREKARELLTFMGIAEHAKDLAGSLPYGKQRKLEIARALALSPKLLLLDEPAAGLNPSETEELTMLISKLQHEKDMTILLIEHDMRLVMEICEWIFVLDHGEQIAAGTAKEVQSNAEVIEAYLGVAE